MEEETMTLNNYGLYVNPDELKKRSKITIWGQMVMKDRTIGPWVPILDIPIDMKLIKQKTALIGTYISLEVAL
ncbi:MAG: hypothetical protein K9N21_02730 [Deltaproteobacteria bacterium]|nr:hypothetical protein [Deltaproteobacteria bacterium]